MPDDPYPEDGCCTHCGKKVAELKFRVGYGMDGWLCEECFWQAEMEE